MGAIILCLSILVCAKSKISKWTQSVVMKYTTIELFSNTLILNTYAQIIQREMTKENSQQKKLNFNYNKCKFPTIFILSSTSINQK